MEQKPPVTLEDIPDIELWNCISEVRTSHFWWWRKYVAFVWDMLQEDSIARKAQYVRIYKKHGHSINTCVYTVQFRVESTTAWNSEWQQEDLPKLVYIYIYNIHLLNIL